MDKKALLDLTYGMYLVATEYKGEKAGYIANTVFQVTSTPPQIAVSCHKENHTLKILLKSGIFSVSVLGKNTPAGLIGAFGYVSGTDQDKFDQLKMIKGQSGAPVVTESAVAWLDCRVVQSMDAGSHVIFIGEVIDSSVLSDEEPLTYRDYRIRFRLSSPRHSPTYQEEESVSEVKAPEEREEDNEPYICMICGHVYRPEEGDPSAGIPPGTPFTDLPEEYRCPVCNAGKDYFKPLG